jgi:hypothetical protein
MGGISITSDKPSLSMAGEKKGITSISFIRVAKNTSSQKCDNREEVMWW